MQEPSSDLLALADVLAQAATRIARVANRETVNAGTTVTRSQRAALAYLAAHGSCTMLDLAAGVGVTAPTMTATVKILLRKGLIDRRHDDVDWRTVVVSISEMGTLALHNAVSRQAFQIGATIQRLPAEQRAMLTAAAQSFIALARLLDEPAHDPSGEVG